MGLFRRKSTVERLVDTVGDALDVSGSVKKASVPGGGAGKALKAGLITAGGVVGLTAGSAGISAIRRRMEGARDGS